MEEAWEQGQSRDNSRQFKFWLHHLNKGQKRIPDSPRALCKFFFPGGEKGSGRKAMRDPVGGTLIHWCMLLGSGKTATMFPQHRQIACHIIQHCDVRILNLEFDRGSPNCMEEAKNGTTWVRTARENPYPYSKLWYDGETALHIAVAKADEELVEALLKRGVDCKARAVGSFFAPGPGSYCYFGEYALSFAASAGMDSLVRLLVQADRETLDLPDSYGNKAFHLAILHRKVKTYKLLVELSGRAPSEVAKMKGALALTPLSMAAFVGPKDHEDITSRADVFVSVWESTADVAWEFTDVIAHTYDLKQVDTLCVDNGCDFVECVPGTGVVSEAASEANSLPSSPKVARLGDDKVDLGSANPVVPAVAPDTCPSPDAADDEGSDVAGDEAPEVDCEEDGETVLEAVASWLGAITETHEVASEDEAEERALQQLKENLEISENNEYISLLALVVHYDLLYMANEEIIIDMLNAKWGVVRRWYFLSILFHFVYIISLSLYTVAMHPKFAFKFRDEKMAARGVAAFLTLMGLIPIAHDFAAGLVRMKRVSLLRRSVPRAPRPRVLRKNPTAWKTYKEKTDETVPQFEISLLNRLTETFPISGFDVLAWVGYCLFVAHIVCDGADTDGHFDTYGNANDTDGDGLLDAPTTPMFLVFLGLSTLCAWLSLLTFAPIHLRLGMVVTMILRTLYLDLVPFMVVFLILLGGSVGAIYSLTRNGYDVLDVVDILKDSFIPVIGTNVQLNTTREYPQSDMLGPARGIVAGLAYFLVVVFSVLWALLMLNLFIAALTSTYESVKARANLEYRLQWGRDIVLMERRLLLFSKYRHALRVNHGDVAEHMYYAITKKKDEGETEREDPGTPRSGGSLPPSPFGSRRTLGRSRRPTIREQLHSPIVAPDGRPDGALAAAALPHVPTDVPHMPAAVEEENGAEGEGEGERADPRD
eukprot:TRINITY_DN1234_c0_g2_i6.p1 TRINITY_DN1234_c0_g2~~TRINITY_DN1234_c0_g2_i6.p1  ORF type:complete len:936 (+),score=283.10 TRINITY_DN1234_c0_g2_i6:537-3344(+)